MANSVRKEWWLLGAALLVLVAGIAAVSGQLNDFVSTVEKGEKEDELEVVEENPAPTQMTEGETISEDLEVFDVQDAVEQTGKRYIVGKVRSKSGKPYTYIEINFSLHDASQTVLGAVTANSMGLKAGETWDFHVEVRNPRAAKYRLARSYGW